MKWVRGKGRREGGKERRREGEKEGRREGGKEGRREGIFSPCSLLPAPCSLLPCSLLPAPLLPILPYDSSSSMDSLDKDS
jgi:hypothetical protein